MWIHAVTIQSLCSRNTVLCSWILYRFRHVSFVNLQFIFCIYCAFVDCHLCSSHVCSWRKSDVLPRSLLSFMRSKYVCFSVCGDFVYQIYVHCKMLRTVHHSSCQNVLLVVLCHCQALPSVVHLNFRKCAVVLSDIAVGQKIIH